jgi:hypothetical protein
MGLARDVMLFVEEPETNEVVDSGWKGDGRDGDMVSYRRRGWLFDSEANAILLDVNLASSSSRSNSMPSEKVKVSCLFQACLSTLVSEMG